MSHLGVVDAQHEDIPRDGRVVARLVQHARVEEHHLAVPPAARLIADAQFALPLRNVNAEVAPDIYIYTSVNMICMREHERLGTSTPRWHVSTKLHRSEWAAMAVCGGILAKKASTRGTFAVASSSHYIYTFALYI